MESVAILRSFNCTVSHMRSMPERFGLVLLPSATLLTSSKSPIQGLRIGRKLVPSPIKLDKTLVSCVRTPDTIVTTKSDVASLDDRTQGSVEKKALGSMVFPKGFEALVLEVCDETQIAELKLKVGDFEMHLKRNVGATEAHMPVATATTAPPIPSKPMIEPATSSPPPTPPKSSSGKNNPFANVPVEKSAKLAALEASGAAGYVLVSSPTVGSFRKGRTFKGKKQPPICKQGDLIKEGQTIGFVDQFGTELPVKSDVAGEVMKLLFDDGEAVGYGDPLIAVLPSFHGIK